MKNHLKPRKLKSKVHKHFGNHSRTVDGIVVKPENAGGRSVGSKQILPGDYGRKQTGGYGDHRTKAELLNDAEINHTEE